MGRTVPTYRNVMEEIIEDWRKFRRALRKGDREIFDELIKHAREHASAATYQGRADPAEMIFLSILIEQEKLLRRLKEWKDGSSTSIPTTAEE